MALPTLIQVQRIVRNPHFWILLTVFVICIPMHYLEIWFFPSSFLGLSRHAIDRIIFLLLIVYAGIIFGMRGGIASLTAALTIMLPRAIFISPSPRDALLEVGGVTAVGILVNLWLDSERRGKEQRQQSILRLEAAQRELQLKERRLVTLNTICSIINQFIGLEQVLSRAVTEVAKAMDVEVALIFLLDKEAQELELKAYHGVSKEFAERVPRMRVGEGLNGRVAESGEPLMIKDTSDDSQVAREVVEGETVAQLFVPLESKGKVMGTLSVGTSEPKEFTLEEVEMLAAVGNELGIAIENAYLYQDQLATAKQLVQSERRYRELFEKAQDAILVHDLDGNIITANQATAKVTGYELEELCHKNVRALLNEQSLHLAVDIRQKLLRGQAVTQPYEQQLIRKDGTEANLMLSTSLLTRDGRPEAFQNIARDVTEERRMAENLRYYVQQITKAQEEERKRIARELHDDTAQALVALSRQLDSLILAKPPMMQDVTSLEKLREQIDRILDGVRRFSQDLRPSVLDDLGLLPALEWLVSDLTDRFGISLGLAVMGPERHFSPETELLLFRIAQEALRNVWRHSGAARAWISVEFGKDKTILTVRDNGKGFEVPKRLSDLAEAAKLGLAGMEERAKLLGGNLRLHSELGKGTTVIVEIPM